MQNISKVGSIVFELVWQTLSLINTHKHLKEETSFHVISKSTHPVHDKLVEFSNLKRLMKT